jgi:hypothetical protein
MQVVVDHERDPERHSCYRQRFTRLAGLSDTPRDGGFIPVQATNGARPARGRAADIDAEIGAIYALDHWNDPLCRVALSCTPLPQRRLFGKVGLAASEGTSSP